MIDEQQRKLIMYFLLIMNLISLGTLFSTQTIDIYQAKIINKLEVTYELAVRFDYWGKGSLRNDTLIGCTNYFKEEFRINCRVIEQCKYQAFFSIFITLLSILLYYLKSYVKNFQTQYQLIIMITLLSGALNTILIPMFRQSIDNDQLLFQFPVDLTPGILELIIAAQFTILVILQNQSIKGLRNRAINNSSKKNRVRV